MVIAISVAAFVLGVVGGAYLTTSIIDTEARILQRLREQGCRTCARFRDAIE